MQPFGTYIRLTNSVKKIYTDSKLLQKKYIKEFYHEAHIGSIFRYFIYNFYIVK